MRVTNQPLGSTSVRSGGIRYIKVSDTGPVSKRWIQYSRFLWETLKGPVPNGQRVLHRDGNPSNDDIRNLMLGTPADALWLYCHSDPKQSEANYRKCRKATAKSNRLRGVVNRRENWLPTRWYAINVDRQRAWNNPMRQASDVATQLGLRLDGRKIWPIILGYPDGNRAQAIVVRCLTDTLCKTAELFERVTQFAERLGFKPMSRQTLYSALCEVRKRGHVAGDRGCYRLTIPQPAPLAIVRGKQIVNHFQKCCRCDSVSDLMLGG